MLQILIADDHPLFRAALVDLIADNFVGSQLWQAEDFGGCMQLVKQHLDLDLVVLDLHMPGCEGLGGLQQLIDECPTVPVMMVSAQEDRELVLQSMRIGAVGFLVKSLPTEQIVTALQQVLAGEVFLPSSLLRGNSPPVASGVTSQTTALKQLTQRQLCVLRCLLLGKSNKIIAKELHIAETTVKTHVSEILRKLGVENRTQAAVAVDASVLDALLD